MRGNKHYMDLSWAKHQSKILAELWIQDGRRRPLPAKLKNEIKTRQVRKNNNNPLSGSNQMIFFSNNFNFKSVFFGTRYYNYFQWIDLTTTAKAKGD